MSKSTLSERFQQVVKVFLSLHSFINIEQRHRGRLI